MAVIVMNVSSTIFSILVCKRSKDTEPIMKCDNDTLIIRWPTDTSYTADIITIPEPLFSEVNRILMERGPFLNMVVTSLDPP